MDIEIYCWNVGIHVWNWLRIYPMTSFGKYVLAMFDISGHVITKMIHVTCDLRYVKAYKMNSCTPVSIRYCTFVKALKLLCEMDKNLKTKGARRTIDHVHCRGAGYAP
jgi:hypothetical protein